MMLLAPMVGITHRAFRTLVFEFGGVDRAFTEMASAGGYVSGAPFEEYYLDTLPRPDRTSIQFYTIKPGHMIEALAKVSSMPEANRPCGIDINFACSAPQIKRSGGGSAWMNTPDEAFELVLSSRAAWTGTLSAKVRTGQDDDYGRLAEFCRGLEKSGLDVLTIHPRLDSQKFRRKARTDHIARLVGDLSIPVIGNGDIRTYADLRLMRSECAPAGIMIGREAVRRPWIFALFAGLDADPGFRMEIRLEETAFHFLDLISTHLPAEWHMKSARAFFDYYCDNLSFAHHIKWKLLNSPAMSAMKDALGDYFREVPGDRIRIEGR